MTDTYLNISQAARRAGKSRNTIRKWIEDGKLTATKDAQDQWQIAVIDLLSVTPELKPDNKDKQEQRERVKALHQKATRLEHELEVLKVERDSYKRENDLLKRQLDKAEQNQTALIEKLPSAEAAKPQTLLGWLGLGRD